MLKTKKVIRSTFRCPPVCTTGIKSLACCLYTARLSFSLIASFPFLVSGSCQTLPFPVPCFPASSLAPSSSNFPFFPLSSPHNVTAYTYKRLSFTVTVQNTTISATLFYKRGNAKWKRRLANNRKTASIYQETWKHMLQQVRLLIACIIAQRSHSPPLPSPPAPEVAPTVTSPPSPLRPSRPGQPYKLVVRIQELQFLRHCLTRDPVKWSGVMPGSTYYTSAVESLLHCMGSKYCDQSVCVYVCLSVSLSARVSQKSHVQSSPNFYW